MPSIYEEAKIIGDLLGGIELASNAMQSYSAAAVGVVEPVISMLLIIYVVVWGWAMARGMVQEPVMDAFMRFVKIAFIFALAMKAPYYSTYIKDFVWDFPEFVAQTISGQGTTSTVASAQAFGVALKIGSDYITEAGETGSNGVPNLSLLAVGIGVWGGGAALTGIIIGTLVIARIVLAVLLAVGPIFIMLILFESTKKLFDAWMGQIVTYMIVIVTTIIASSIVIEIMALALATYLPQYFANWIINGDVAPSPGSGIGLIIVYGICGVAIQKIVMMADAIGRSISLSSYIGSRQT
jgi:type IV secretion system protein VirB6